MFNCSDFYIRRQNNELHQLTDIDLEKHHKAFEAWQAKMDIGSIEFYTSSMECPALDANSKEATQNGEKTGSDPETLINTVHVYDTQMSPLIYQHSDSDQNADETVENPMELNIVGSQNVDSTCSTLIQCSQISDNDCYADELSATVLFKSNQRQAAHNASYKLDNKNRSFDSATKRLKYKTLNILNNSRRNERSRLSKSLTSSCNSSNDRGRNALKVGSRHDIPSTSTTSADVQIISEKIASPITVVGSSSENQKTPVEDPTAMNRRRSKTADFCAELLSMSPDLFTSFESVRDQNEGVIAHESDDDDDVVQPFDLALSTTVNNDIFEITRNNVFDNVLCSAVDRITPVKSNNEPKNNSGPCCLTGIRVLIPAFGDRRTEQQIMHESPEADIPTSSGSVILVNSQPDELDDVVVISSEESTCTAQQSQRTPTNRRLSLTPSTRSCLRPDSKSNNRNERCSTSSRWISKKSSTSTPSTAESRRRLNKWLSATKQTELPDQSPRSSKPRNLFNEMTAVSRHRNHPKNMLNSPSIFSDDDL